MAARQELAVLASPKIVKNPLMKGNGKVETVFLVAETAYKFYNWSREWYRRRFSYTVTLTEKDAIYQDVHDWLLSVTPHEKRRTLKVTSQEKRNYESSDEPTKAGEQEKIKPLSVRFNDSMSRTIVVEGHKVEVNFYEPDISDKSEAYLMRFEPDREVSFRAFSHEAQQAVIRQLEALNQKRAVTRKAVLKMMNQWGSWRTRSDLPPRTMESVSLPAVQKERIIADLRGFLEAEEKYNRLAIPWHRGYMFYGPPGTGKTSLVKGLANEFNLDLWYISLADLKAETSLLGLLSEVGPRSMLLLEDIDTIKITHDRDAAETGSISMGSLLNTLDGVGTPHGLITVMTTNRFDILDSALTRAGRMDLIEELAYPGIGEIQDMFYHFYGRNARFSGIKHGEFMDKKISTSQIAEIMKRYLDDPDRAEKEIKQFVKGR